MPRPIPAVLLGRLAVDHKEQGHGLGRYLVRDAIIRTLWAAEVIGVRALLVHAASEDVRRFYLRLDFEPSPTDPLHLMLLLKDARANMTGT
jgi:predicted N-acetyltransferase YhbS